MPVIRCGLIDEMLRFYQSAFRYIIINKTQTADGLQWVHLKSDNSYLMLQKNHHTSEKKSNSGNILLYYYTNDVTAQHQFMTARGIKVGEIEDTTYHVRQYFVKDPEANVIAVGQNI